MNPRKIDISSIFFGKLHSQRGIALMGLVFTFILLGGLMTGVVSLISTGGMEVVPVNAGDNARNLAESGYRYAAAQYLNTENLGYLNNPDDLSADDEKARFLEEKVDGTTYVMPEQMGSIDLTVHPYWLIASRDYVTPTNVIRVRFPGTQKANFSFPDSGTIKRGEEVSQGFAQFTAVSPVTGSDDYQFTLSSSIPSLDDGTAIHFVLNPNTNQSIQSGSDLILAAPTGSHFVPPKNGLIEIGAREETNYEEGEEELANYYTYRSAAFGQPGDGQLTLYGLSWQQKMSTTDPKTDVMSLDQNSRIVFKKFINMVSQGTVGSGEYVAVKNINFYTPIQDSLPDPPPDVFSLTRKEDFAHFTWDTDNIDLHIEELYISGGSRGLFTVMDRIKNYTSDSHGYFKQGEVWFNNTSKINENWEKNDHLLNYDLQTKVGVGKYLENGAIGLSFRGRNVDTSSESNFGVSYLLYRHTTLGFYEGTSEISVGDTIRGSLSNATAQVIGVQVTGGSWGSYYDPARGILTLSNVSNEFSHTSYYSSSRDSLIVDDLNVARVTQNSYNTDNIPESIKPEYGNFENNKENRLLFVLWQKKADGSLRWLAYKDIQHDLYVLGKQDWPYPANDGQVVNDEATLMIRIREKHEDRGGSIVKVNEIEAFYGDASKKYTSRTPNNIPYDIMTYRKRYLRGINFPTWAPKKIAYWDVDHDYFTHFELPLGHPEFHWDALNTTVTDPAVFELDFTAGPVSQGKVRISDLTTPDSGSYYQCEVGMHSFGNITTTPYSTAGFIDFSLKFYFEGYLRGGFLASYQE